jgi:hypothetical protein
MALNQQAVMHFSLEMGMRIRNLGQDFSYISRVQRKGVFSESMTLLLRGCWCNTSIFNVHTLEEDNNGQLVWGTREGI